MEDVRFRAVTRLAAYLDPGSGSMLVQIVAGGVAAVAVAGKFYWRRLLRALHLKRAEGED